MTGQAPPKRCTCGWWPKTEDEYFDRLRGAEAALQELREELTVARLAVVEVARQVQAGQIDGAEATLLELLRILSDAVRP